MHISHLGVFGIHVSDLALNVTCLGSGTDMMTVSFSSFGPSRSWGQKEVDWTSPSNEAVETMPRSLTFN